VHKAAQRAGMAAPAVAVSGAMAAAPVFITAPQVHQALAAARPHAVTAHLDAVVQPAAPAARTYTVQPGDTLFGIALRYYGHGRYWHGLYKVNQGQISDPNLIYVGQVLRVPRRHVVAAAMEQSDPSSATTTAATSQSTGTQATQSSASSSSASSSSASGSSASGSSAVQSDIADGNNLLAVAQYLVDNGYSDAAAAGVASCVDGESAGNPESVGSGGGGLIGWTPISSAAPNGNIITGDTSADMMTQLADILFYNSNEIGQSLVDELNSQTDPVAAADFYSQNFEKPAVTDSDVVPSVAEQIFSELGG
jgi:LysM repeat protein